MVLTHKSEIPKAEQINALGSPTKTNSEIQQEMFNLLSLDKSQRTKAWLSKFNGIKKQAQKCNIWSSLLQKYQHLGLPK